MRGTTTKKMSVTKQNKNMQHKQDVYNYWLWSKQIVMFHAAYEFRHTRLIFHTALSILRAQAAFSYDAVQGSIRKALIKNSSLDTRLLECMYGRNTYMDVFILDAMAALFEYNHLEYSLENRKNGCQRSTKRARFSKRYEELKPVIHFFNTILL